MGNAESGVAGASGDEEDVEAESPGFAEDSPASAATGVGAGTAGGSGSGKSGRPTINNPPSTNGPPTPGVLLEQVKLREAAARISDSGLAIPESVLAGNEIALMRWLEDRLSRGEESVNVEQFCEMLEIRNAPRDECEEAFGQFDTEGDGVVDVESMLSALKNSNGANLQGELSHVIRHLQACSLTPGFVDIFSKYKDELGAHASKILKFLHRNRIPSSAIPFPLLEGYNSICTMRSTLVQNFLEFLLQKEKELIRDPDVDKVKVVTQCFSFIEASSNATDIHRMTDGETGSFWQSDGSARSHWIRLKMKPDVVLRRLAIAVASNDHSYMPQLVSVAVGKNRRSLQEIRDIRIPSNVTGYVALLENANITHPYIQINIKRCLSDGCDTRIHGLKTLGYQITKSKEVSVSDASAIWYLSLLTSLVTASMETNPVLAQTVLQSTQKALRHMPPLSLTPSSTEFPKFFSANILEEVDGFLLRIADCCVSPEAELTLLAFALARGSVAKVLQALSGISEHLETEYRASSLISSMASVRMRLLYRKPLQLHLQACDVKSKEEKSGPENMLAEPTTGDGFLTESGKKRASIILSTEDQSNFQVTQMKVRKGATGAKCGSGCDQPIGWFELEEDWNDVEIKLQQCRIAKFLMVKFLCTRQTSAERLGVQSLCFHGYLVVGAERLGDAEELLPDGGEGPEDLATTGQMLLNKTLFFIQQLTRDMVGAPLRGQSVDCLPRFSPLIKPRASSLYTRVCVYVVSVVDRPETEALVEKALRREAVKALLSGAAIFFPDKHSRRDKLFHMMVSHEDQPESVKVTFESLCNYFSDQDPSGLLLLPPKEVSTDFDISPILSVMETLLLVATRECEVMMGAVSGGPSRTVLLSLFWALQGSLLSWCYLQLKADTSGMGAQLARDIVVKYVNQFLGSAQGALASLLERYSGAEITEKLSSSILATVTRQLMIFLLELCSLDIPHSVLLKSFSSLVELLKNLSSDTGDIFSKVDQESCLQPQQPVVLRTWNMESPHNYENSRHETTIFCCPGATSFVVEFDERCQTEKRYDYLEFTDARGGKVRYDTKIGTEKWPKKVTFDAGPQLQFLFHSDSSNNEWGYKFSVTAQGLPDITVSWMSDVQLLVARLMGRLASRAMALKSPHGRMAHVQSSPLWKPILRHGACDARDTPQNNTPSFPRFLEDLARWNPNLEPNEGPAEPMRTLMLSCRRPPIRNEIAAGSTVDQAVNAIWAAMVYHTPALHQALKAHVAQGYKSSLSEDFVQVYTLADRIRTWMVGVLGTTLSTTLHICPHLKRYTYMHCPEVCIQKSLLLLRFPPSGDTSGPAEGSSAPLLLRSCSVSEGDFQPTTSPVAATASAAAAAAAPLALALAQTEEPAGPPSASSVPRRPIRRTLGRVRLLSYRSVEEPRTVLSVRERYPILKHLLNFMKDQALTTGSVLQTLALNKAQAQSVCRVLESVQQGLLSLGKPHLFQAPCILFLQELLACQKDFNGYFSQLSGSGQELREEVRRSYHQLVLMLVEAVQGFSGLNEKALLPALSCVQTCLLHLLDMSWEPQDLPLFLDIKLPDLLLNMSQENISVHDIAISQWTEEDEIAVYKKNQEWMDECADGMFEKWYDKIGEEGSVEDRRKMHRFIARYCDLLNVVISCDGCERIAPWHRYRCLQCMDMDLCKTCFLSGAKPEGHEDDHEMVNMEYACDHCQGLIVGSRINCNVCEDFDLCFGCYNAKKYPDSHLPTHRITVFPMVTIRISDRHRLIQPYIHNYSWLLFAALALYTSALASERRLDGEPLKTGSLDRALALQGRCSQLITECLLKASEPTGLALAASPASEPTGLAAAASPASEPTGLALAASPASEPTGLAAAASPASEPTGLALAASPASEPTGLAAAASPASEPTGLAAAASPASEAGKEQAERLSQAPRQDHVFSDCSRERILGLLAAMLPPAKPVGAAVHTADLFRVVVSNAGCLDETYHLTLGLLGQLLLRIPPAEADGAVGEALADKYELLAQLEAAGTETPGWKTTQLLFCLGAVCLDSRIGLDWACSVADILRGLNACPQWSVVIAAFTDHCVQQLPHTLRRTNLFTLLVLVGFPEVLCMGTQSVFVDNANEQHHMILLKHFTEKNHAAVVDVKTRKRKTVKDYQLIQPQDSSWAGLPAQAEGQPAHKALISRYLDSFISIISHLLKGSPDPGSPDAVEASWVLSLALKGLYNTLKVQGVEEAQQAIQRSGLTQLLVRKCSKGTGFSKLWLLRDLEILSVMLYSSKREIHSMTQDPERDEREPEPDREQDSDHSSCCTEEPRDPSRPDPLEGLDEETKICFQITHDALNAPLHILRAMYELQMKRTDSFFLEVQKRFDGDVIKTDETIRTLAQKWQPSRRPRSERTTKAVDTDMIVVSCVAKPSHCERATEEINLVAQKLITSSEGDLQLSYAKQRRTKSSALLHKELDARSNRAVRQYLVKVNQAIATLYARHVLAALLAEWPAGQPLSDEALELSGSSHMAYILDMLVQLEEKTLWEKILQRVLKGCGQSMLCSLSLTACQFMEEPGMAVQIRESKHPYDNNTNFEDKVHIPGAIYLSVKFDPRCHSEEGCDELIMSSSADFLQDLHTFSGSPQKWSDFEIPGTELCLTRTSKGKGLRVPRVWGWGGVLCESYQACELMLLRPLWQLFVSMETTLCQDPACITVLLPLHRALTELFFIAESRAQGILQEYLLAMTTDQQLLNHTAMALKNIAAISLAINYPNKSTKLLSMPS
uniref:Zinc finger ZZ-type and EF-hand domain containing 1 n=1 Tax=Gadus morhua TaxID=8049 RepID=A0A8C5D009_GADMO